MDSEVTFHKTQSKTGLNFLAKNRFESHEITSAKQSSFEKEQNKDRFAKRGGVKWSRCQSTPNLGNMNKDNPELDELKKPRQTDIGAILKVLSKNKFFIQTFQGKGKTRIW